MSNAAKPLRTTLNCSNDDTISLLIKRNGSIHSCILTFIFDNVINIKLLQYKFHSHLYTHYTAHIQIDAHAVN